jgi:argininosuccinate lyase
VIAAPPTPDASDAPDIERFPHPDYARTVLEPLFDGTLEHHAKGMDAINEAHLVMLAETGIIAPADASAIARSLDEIAREIDRGALTYTGEHEDWFFLVEAQLTERLGDLAGALHTARSRNDIDHTLFRMALRERATAMQGRFLALAETLAAKARAEAKTLIVAYTHGQPAQPTTFGHWIAAALDVLLRDVARLDGACAALDDCPMGAAAITTTGFSIDRERVADLLGFARPTTNAYGSIAAVDYVTGYYSALKLPFVHLGRVVQDLQFWSAFEVGQLHVPGSLVQVSSIMPQKRNPVPIEHMRHLASVAAFRCDVMVNTMHNTPFTDMNDSEGEVQAAGHAAFESGGRMADLLAAFLPAVRIDGTRVRANMDAACVTITELADTLVRTEGLTFRAAHHVAAVVARDVIARGVPLSGGWDAFIAAFAEQAGRRPGLDRDGFAEAVAPETFVLRRDRPGGPAPAALAAALDRYEAETARLRAAATAREDRYERAAQARRAAFDALKET